MLAKNDYIKFINFLVRLYKHPGHAIVYICVAQKLYNLLKMCDCNLQCVIVTYLQCVIDKFSS